MSKRCKECMRQQCICGAPSRALAPPPPPPPPAEDDDEREEVGDTGLAQNDRVSHPKRGLGQVVGFYGEFVCVNFDNEPGGQHKYSYAKCIKTLTRVDGAAPAPPPVAATGVAGFSAGDRVTHSSHGNGTVSGFSLGKWVHVDFDDIPDEEFQYDRNDAKKKLSKSNGGEVSLGALDQDIGRVRAISNAEKPPAPVSLPPAAPDDDDEREEVGDTGLAQNDRVTHPKRGLGTVVGFWGEFVCVAFDNEPGGQHKYSYAKCIKTLTRVDGATPAPPPVAATGVAGFKEGDRVTHSNHGQGTVTGFSLGKYVHVDFDDYPDEEFQYDRSDAKRKLGKQ